MHKKTFACERWQRGQCGVTSMRHFGLSKTLQLQVKRVSSLRGTEHGERLN